MKIGLIGIGNMNGAILNGLIKTNSFDIHIYNRSAEKIKDYDVVKHTNIVELINSVDVIILGYKPVGYIEFLKEYGTYLADKLFISIAAGMSSETLSKYLTKFVITMPNTPVLTNHGVVAIVDSKYNDLVSSIFNTLGEVIIIKEEQMHDFISLGGSSPAYFYYIIDCMLKAQTTFDYDTALKIVSSTMQGSALMAKRFDDMEALVNNVCSPNGTTIEAVTSLKYDNLENIFKNAMDKCSSRSKVITNDISKL